MRRSISLATAVLVGGLLLSSCSDSGSEDGGFQVTSEVVSHEATKDMLVFAPDAEGSWPVIVAFHGVGGTPEDMAEIATRLAREGNVVFARPTGPTSRLRRASTRQASMPNVAIASPATSRPTRAER
jgi:poly(3-hydroxybutyrate) depolymerase